MGLVLNLFPLPAEGSTWFVKKPKGELFLVDDLPGNVPVQIFTNQKFNTFYSDKYDVFNIEATKLPYESITFSNTLKLY